MTILSITDRRAAWQEFMHSHQYEAGSGEQAGVLRAWRKGGGLSAGGVRHASIIFQLPPEYFLDRFFDGAKTVEEARKKLQTRSNNACRNNNRAKLLEKLKDPNYAKEHAERMRRNKARYNEMNGRHSKKVGDAFRKYNAELVAICNRRDATVSLLRRRVELLEINAAISKIEAKITWRTEVEAIGKPPKQPRAFQNQVAANRRRVRMLSVPGDISPSTWYNLMKSHNYECAYCGMKREEHRRKFRTDLEIDHIHPITSDIAWNDEHNIVPSCKPCNSSKSNSDLLVWGVNEDKWHPEVKRKYNFIKELASL